MGSHRPSKVFGIPGERSRVDATLLAWSSALRVCHRITLQTSIEYVVLFLRLPLIVTFFLELDKAVSVLARNYGYILTKRCPVEYWSCLLSSVNFDGHPLKSCVNIIHEDAVEIWNIKDRTRVGFLPYLLRFFLTGTSFSRAMDSKLRCLNSSEI